MTFVLLAALGQLQFYSALFMTKYFDYTFYRAYGLLILAAIQILSLWTCLWQEQFLRIRAYLYPAYFGCLSLLSMSSEAMPIALIVIATLFMFSFVQSEIIFLFKQRKVAVEKLYAAEMIGGTLGILNWYFFSARLGYPGFALMSAATVFFLFARIFRSFRQCVFLLVPVVWILFFTSEPQPFVPKRDRDAILRAGKVIDKKWDTNGSVELVALSPLVHKFLFDGGEMQSNVYAFRGNFARLKSEYENSQARLAWGLDVVLPHFIRGREGSRVALISAIGGQEILAAKAFNAQTIDVIDINETAQKIMQTSELRFSGNIYDFVQTHHDDGRRFIKQSKELYDIIQIYSSESGAFSSAFGSIFRPSSLITVEALQDYDRRLANDGVLQITSSPLAKLNATFADAFGEEGTLDGEKIFAYKRANDADDLVSFAYKKNGWKLQERETLKAWLSADVQNHWRLLSKADSPARERFNNSDFGTRASTDDWPFFKIASDRDFTVRLFYFLIAAGVLFSAYIFTRFRSKSESPIVSDAFWMGVTYSMAQSFGILSFQRMVGAPSTGLTVAMSCVLILTTIAANFAERNIHERIPRQVQFLLALSLAPVYLLSWQVSLAIVGVLIFLQSSSFARLLERSANKINLVLWSNGLGFGFGMLAFNVSFAACGLLSSVALMSAAYISLSHSVTQRTSLSS